MRKRRSVPAEASISRRRLLQAGTVIPIAIGSAQAAAAAAAESGPEVYTRLGVKPFINCTATLTINGGSLMLPEVISAMEQAAHFHVRLDELMEKAGDRLAELLQVGWGLITSGTAAALTHATAGCLAGTDPEKIQRLPNLDGMKNEVIIPRESRNGYDHAIRALGVRVVEVNSVEELRAAINPRTAMVELLGNHFGQAALDLKDVAPIARAAGIPILVDAAADYLIVPNPYIAKGADLVAYSGGKIIRGPQGAGLLVGRRDLVRAAWANSAPHHAFGRGMKVTKEEIVGMLRAVEAWRTDHDLQADFEKWKSWHSHIAGRITEVPGVQAEAQGPIRGGPFPTLKISWDPERIALTAGEVGRLLLNGEPRIMTQAAGESHSFLLRPVAMKAGEYEVVARRLHEIFVAAPKKGPKRILRQPSRSLAGTWEMDIDYETGSARHQLVLAVNGNIISGAHTGWAYQGDIEGEIDGDRVRFRSTLPADGNVLTYSFEGAVSTSELSGRVQIGDYGSGKWRARLLSDRAAPK
jgi:D-glucosaminate-6-phosphate ammonia-lyase